MNLKDNIVEDGKREFYSIVKNSIVRFLNKYKLNITIKGETAAEILRNLIVEMENLNLPHKLYIIIDEYDNFTNVIVEEINR